MSSSAGSPRGLPAGSGRASRLTSIPDEEMDLTIGEIAKILETCAYERHLDAERTSLMARPEPWKLPEGPRAAGPAAGAVRSAAPRRDAVHRDPPGLRALVQADAPRGERCGARPFGSGHATCDAPLPPTDRDPACADSADLRPRDDDAAGLHGVPRAPQPRLGLSVLPVPDARVPLGLEGAALSRDASGRSRGG